MTGQGCDPAWEAVQDLYVRFIADVRAHARKYLGKRAAAEDVAQEVFVAAFNQWNRDLSTVEGRKLVDAEEGDQLAWLKTVARNKSIDRMRGGRRERPTEDVDVVAASERTGPLEQVVSRDMSERLWKVLDQHVTQRERDVVVLAFVEEMTNREIADALGISIATVRSHKHHVRNKIEGIVPGIMFPEDSADDEHGIGEGL